MAHFVEKQTDLSFPCQRETIRHEPSLLCHRCVQSCREIHEACIDAVSLKQHTALFLGAFAIITLNHHSDRKKYGQLRTVVCAAF